MDVQIADVGTLRKQLTLTYSEKEVDQRASKLLKTYGGQAKVEGFRSGKIPLSVLKRRYGKAAREQTVDQLLQDGMREAIEDHKLKPLGPINDEERQTDEGIKLVTSFDVHPEVVLPDPDSFEITREDISVSEEEVEEELAGLARRSGETKDLEADADLQADDTITLSGKITSGDETVREVHDLNHLLGSYPLFGTSHEEVLEMVKGKKVGDELAFDTTLPEHFHPDEWAGKDAHVSVTIQRAQRLQPAEIDDAFAKSLGVEEGVGALRERVEESIKSRKENQQHQEQLEQVTEQLVEKTDFEVPQAILDTITKEQLAQAKTGGDEEQPDEETVRAEQERMLRRHIAISAVAEQFEVQATQQDLQQQIMMAAYQSGRQPQELAQQLEESGRMPQVIADIREAKAVETLLAKVLGDDEEAEGASEEAESEAEAAETADKE